MSDIESNAPQGFQTELQSDEYSHEDRKYKIAFRLGLIFLVVLVGVAAFGNVFLTVYFNERGFRGSGPQHISFVVALALLLAQPCLLSIWCALGGERFWVRAVASTAIAAGLTMLHLKGFELAGFPVPFDVCAMIIGIVIAFAIVVQTPLWIYRSITKLSIRLPREGSSQPTVNQFSIKHLLIAMTVAALIVTGTKAVLPEIVDNDLGAGFWGVLLSFVPFFIVTFGLLSFIALAVVFSSKQRLVFVALAALFFLVAPLAAIYILQNTAIFGGGTWSFWESFNTYILLWSVGGALITVLSIYYLIGYRLEKAQT